MEFKRLGRREVSRGTRQMRPAEPLIGQRRWGLRSFLLSRHRVTGSSALSSLGQP